MGLGRGLRAGCIGGGGVVASKSFGSGVSEAGCRQPETDACLRVAEPAGHGLAPQHKTEDSAKLTCLRQRLRPWLAHCLHAAETYTITSSGHEHGGVHLYCSIRSFTTWHGQLTTASHSLGTKHHHSTTASAALLDSPSA